MNRPRLSWRLGLFACVLAIAPGCAVDLFSKNEPRKTADKEVSRKADESDAWSKATLEPGQAVTVYVGDGESIAIRVLNLGEVAVGILNEKGDLLAAAVPQVPLTLSGRYRRLDLKTGDKPAHVHWLLETPPLRKP